MKWTTVWLAMAFVLTLPSCGLFHWKKTAPPKKTEEKKPETKLVGRIASVSTDRTFVLIQSYGTWEVEAGGILTTQGTDGRLANLRCTGEKLGQFAAADIQAGEPRAGDAVFHASPPPAKQESSSTPPAAPEQPKSANPQISKT
ncbi:MAG TPA: hypothetical protein VIM57_05060 [Luteolibacter sp.]